MNKMKKATLVFAAFILVVASAYAIAPTFYKELAGIGILKFTGEVTITDISATDTQVDVTLESTTTKTFTVTLYLDGFESATQSVAFPPETQTISFPGLDLSSVTIIKVEVTATP